MIKKLIHFSDLHIRLFKDHDLYKLRYKYSENISANSRKFCRQMVGDSARGVVFRYEDIADMSASGVNQEFAAEGQSTYDIFTWKGGSYCHHTLGMVFQ